MGDAGKVNPLSQHGECHGETMNKQQIGKTDRIIIEMGQQIVGGKYVPGAALPGKRSCAKSLRLHAISSAKYCVR